MTPQPTSVRAAFGRRSSTSTDIVQRRFVEHTLQLAIQAITDVASHIVSDERFGEPAAIVRDVVENHLDDFAQFAAAIRNRSPSSV